MYEAMIAALGGLVVMILGAVGALLKQLWDQRQAVNRTSVGDYTAMLDRCEKRIDRLERSIEEGQDVIERLVRDRTDAQVELAELYGDYTGVHAFLSRVLPALARLGEDAGPVPPLRPRPPRPDPLTEQQRRAALQNVRLLKKDDGGTPPCVS